MTLLTLDKLKRRVPEIAVAAIRATRPIEELRTCAAPGSADDNAMAPPPPADAPEWRPLRPGERWGFRPGADPYAPRRTVGWWGHPADNGSNHWLRAALRVPDSWRGQPVLLTIGGGPGEQFGIEGIIYLDGQALAGVDWAHRDVLLPPAAHDGQRELLIRCYLPFARDFDGLSLQLRDEAIFQLGQVMRATLGAVETYPDSDPRRHALLARLNAAYNALDLREGWQSTRFAASAQGALALLQESVVSGQLSVAPTLKSGATDNGQRTTDNGQPTIVATGHAHLDVAWLWPLWRSRQKVAHTVATVLNLMERYPDYHFSMSQPQVYTFLKHDDPQLYARLKRRVAEGRFEPVGMMWLETDCNVPSGESIVRQLAHGARFFAEEFGAINHVVWLPDVFGYSAALPQLMRGCGISCFMTTKISWNQFNRMPNDTFRWRGIDGTEVLTHFVTASDQPLKHPADAQFYTYNGMMQPAEVFGLWNHYRQKAINDEVLYLYGYGDGGGGPTEEMLEAARTLGGLPGFPQVRPGRVDQFFERLYERVWERPDLPTWVGELYLEYHRGTYTSQARTKQANRAAELLYREAEWLNAWAVTLGAPSRQEQLDAGWRIILLNQFHDILPGSSIPQVYADSNAQFAQVQRIGREVRDAAAAAVQSLEFGVLNSEQGHAESTSQNEHYVVFNSLPWERTEVVQFKVPAHAAPPILVDTDGQATPTQLVEDQTGQQSLLVEMTVPSYGYVALSTTRATTQTTAVNSKLKTQNSKLENDELRLELDDHGQIASLYDLRHGREIVAPGAKANQLIAYEDRPLNWDAWDIDLFYEEKPYPLHEIVDWHLAEEGPLRAVIAIARRLGQSTIRQRICMWRGSRRVDFVTEVDWQERQTLLRALFPLNVNAARATCEIQFGAVERPTHRNTSWDWARFEVCAHRWVDLSEGDYGIALLNDGKYGHSLHDTTLGLSLLKGAIHPDPDADRGPHRFTYSLLPHAGDWRAGQVVRRAYELNAPLVARTKNQEPRTKNTGSTSGSQFSVLGSASFLSTPTDHIVVETVKVADDGDGLIVRLYEAHNQRGPASLVFGRAVESAVETDLLEREVGPLAVEGREVRFAVRPFEVKTLRVRLD